MKEYSSYTTADFLNDDLFLFWYYSGEGDYYRKIIADCPDREPYLKEAMERLAALKWEKPVLPPKEVDNACLKLEQAIQNRKMSQRKHRLYKMRWWSASVAAAILILFVSVEVIWKSAPAIDYLALLQVNDSVFMSGKTQLFVDDQLKETFEGNPDLAYDQMATDAGEGEFNKLVVSYGKRARVTLCDGTKIWANAGTVLLYPTHFEDKKREIYVDGEIYIDVTPNPEKPFIIKTSDMGVKVLGTSFNVSAYKDESMIETTLVEGSVKLNVVSGGKRMTQMLKPNEKAEYQKGAGKIKVFGVNTEYDTAWKNGEIIFRNHPMDKVLKTLERHYRVVFEVKDNEILKSIITARFKDEQLPQVLEYLKLASGIQYAIHKPTVKDSGSGTSVVEISK